MHHPPLIFLSIFLLLLLPPLTTPLTLTLSVPPHIPALPPSTRAILTAPQLGHRIKTPITRQNTFVFRNLTAPPPALATSPTASSSSNEDVQEEGGAGKRVGTYMLDIACRDYDFLSYGVDVEEEEGGKEEGGGEMRVYRVGRAGAGAGGVVGEKVVVKSGGVVEVRVLRGREYYEGRAGFSPLDLLKNPMILIAVVALGLMFGMPYLMDNMDPEMKKEFEEQQKKSILSGGANAANPLQNFDMAGWMAAKTSGASKADTGHEGSGRDVRRRG